MSKKRKAAEQVETASADLVAERREQLAALFPEAFSEGKVVAGFECPLTQDAARGASRMVRKGA